MKPEKYKHFREGQPVRREAINTARFTGECPNCGEECSVAITKADGEGWASWQKIPCAECGIDFVVDFQL